MWSYGIVYRKTFIHRGGEKGGGIQCSVRAFFLSLSLPRPLGWVKRCNNTENQFRDAIYFLLPLPLYTFLRRRRATNRAFFIFFFFLWEKKESGFLVFFRPFSPFPPRTRLIGQSLSREGGEKVWKSPLVLGCFYCGNVFFHQMLFLSCPKKVLLGEGKTSPPKGTILKVFLSYVAGFQHHVTPTEPLENKKSTFYKPETCLIGIGDKQFHHSVVGKFLSR